MLVNTNISNILERSTEKSKYDAEVKKILSDKQILAWILKYTVKELKEYSVKEIIGCIEGKPEIGTHYVDSEKYTESVEGMNTEDTVPGEGRITYDIRFRVKLLHGECLGMIVNVEAQKKFNPGYDLVTRGIFYCARLLSAQMGNVISAKAYDKLQKVYSIWICMDAPGKAADTITGFSMTQKDIFGHAEVDARYDMLEVVMVYLGKRADGTGTELHQLLNTVLSDNLKPEEKKEILSEQYEIATSVELEGGFISMCNLSDLIEEKGIEQGIEKGIEKGIEQGTIRTLISLVQKKLITIEEAAREAKIEQEEFEKILQK